MYPAIASILASAIPTGHSLYLAGVECDGASYHGSKSARDRDRLRQDCLKEKGWEIVRVWSTDWFDDPDGQTEKLVKQLEELRAQAAERIRQETARRAEHAHHRCGASSRRWQRWLCEQDYDADQTACAPKNIATSQHKVRVHPAECRGLGTSGGG